MTRRSPLELNLANRELEWARLRYWMVRNDEALKERAEAEPKTLPKERIAAIRADLNALRQLDADLAAAGIPVPFVALRGCKVPYPEAIPVLLHHLALPYGEDVKAAILRQLAVPYAGEPAFHAVHRLLRSESREAEHLLFAYGIALEGIATKEQIPALISVAKDPRLGAARNLILIRLAKWRVPEAVQIARDLLDEPSGEWMAIKCLRQLRSWGDRAGVEKRLASPNPDVRAEAKSFLKALERAVRSNPVQ